MQDKRIHLSPRGLTLLESIVDQLNKSALFNWSKITLDKGVVIGDVSFHAFNNVLYFTNLGGNTPHRWGQAQIPDLIALLDNEYGNRKNVYSVQERVFFDMLVEELG